MARPRKPTAHLELVGAFEKNPQRSRDAEPQCDEPVKKPPGLSKNAVKAWEFLCECAVPGVLTKMDSSYLALASEALGNVWANKDATIADMHKVGMMLGKMGMTPSDRSNVVVAKKKQDNPFDEFTKA